jgi:hypothetical protein
MLWFSVTRDDGVAIPVVAEHVAGVDVDNDLVAVLLLAGGHRIRTDIRGGIAPCPRCKPLSVVSPDGPQLVARAANPDCKGCHGTGEVTIDQPQQLLANGIMHRVNQLVTASQRPDLAVPSGMGIPGLLGKLHS